MGLLKVGCLCNSLMKMQPYELKNIYFSRMKLQNFSLSSCHGSSVSNVVSSDVNLPSSFSKVERLAALPIISKKNNKLSPVDEKDISTVERLKKGDPYYPYKDEVDRAKNFLVEDAKLTVRKGAKTGFKLFTGLELKEEEERKIFERDTDVLIIGGGAVGLTIAYALRNSFPFGPRVTVVDKDENFPHLSTNLSQGIVTQQLHTEEEEISILKYGVEFFSSFSRQTEIMAQPEYKLPYDPLGTLVLADCNNAEEIIKRNERLKLHGINNKILDQDLLKEKFPWLNVDDVLFGSLGMMNEGFIDPWVYMSVLKCKALSLGVKFVTAEVIDFGFNNVDIRRVVCKLPDGTYNSIDFARCVLACGLESLNLVKLFNECREFEFGLKLPLEERMRFEYCFHSQEGPGLNTPVVVDSDGTYFRRVGLTGHYVAGVPSVKSGEDDPFDIFHSKIKPFLLKRTPGFCKADLIQGWVDVYDYCIANETGITGPHPDTARIVFALGFSHLGLQYLPALARGVMEFIYYDEYQTIDFTPFHVENLWVKKHLEAEKKKKELLESQQHMSLTG